MSDISEKRAKAAAKYNKALATARAARVKALDEYEKQEEAADIAYALASDAARSAAYAYAAAADDAARAAALAEYKKDISDLSTLEKLIPNDTNTSAEDYQNETNF